MEPTIICPKCKAEIKLTESLGAPTERCREFNPDYAIHPGAILEETLEARGLTKRDTASRCGISAKHLNQILHGKASVTGIQNPATFARDWAFFVSLCLEPYSAGGES